MFLKTIGRKLSLYISLNQWELFLQIVDTMFHSRIIYIIYWPAKITQADKFIMKDKQRQTYLFHSLQIKTDTALINNNT